MIPILVALTLQAAVSLAVPRDPAVQAAAASAGAAQADVVTARAGAPPTLFQSYAASPQSGSAGVLTQRTRIFGISKSFAFPAFTLSQAAGARSSAAAARAMLTQTRYDAAMRTIDAYLGALVSDQQLRIATDAVDTAKRTLDAARLRERAGAGPRIDIDRSIAAFATAQAVEARAQGKRDAAFAALDLAVGMDPTARPALVEPRTPASAAITAPAALALALQSRPDLQASAEQVRAAEAGVSAAYASYAPSLDVSAGNQQGLDGGIPIKGGVVSVAINLPLDTGGALGAKVRRAKFLLVRRRAQLEQLTRAIAVQVETALAGVRAATASVSASERAQRAALAASNAAQLGFSQGAVSAVDVLIAQSQLTASRAALSGARADVVRAFYALRMAEGTEPYALP